MHKYCLVIVRKTWMVKDIFCFDVAAYGHREVTFLFVFLEIIESSIRSLNNEICNLGGNIFHFVISSDRLKLVTTCS